MSTVDAFVVSGAVASTWAMTGVIWVVQLVHYPIFDRIDAGFDGAGWRRFAAHHTRSISFVVGPFMLVEGVTGLWLVADPPGDLSRFWPAVAAASMAVAYGTTAMVSAPLHGRLAQEFDVALHRRLLRSNWIRSAAWTVRGVVVGGVAVAAIT